MGGVGAVQQSYVSSGFPKFRKERRKEWERAEAELWKAYPGAEPAHSWEAVLSGDHRMEAEAGTLISKVLGSADKIGGIQGRVHWVWSVAPKTGPDYFQGKGLTWKTVKPELEQGLVWKNCARRGLQEPIWVE